MMTLFSFLPHLIPLCNLSSHATALVPIIVSELLLPATYTLRKWERQERKARPLAGERRTVSLNTPTRLYVYRPKGLSLFHSLLNSNGQSETEGHRGREGIANHVQLDRRVHCVCVSGDRSAVSRIMFFFRF